MKKLIFPLLFMFLLFPLCAAGKIVFSSKASNTMTKNEALDYCYNLSENGVSGWRLPTTAELSGSNISTGNYWASDREKIEKNYVNEEDKAWFYDFAAKKKKSSFVSTRMNVVCVRNAVQAAPVKPKPKVDNRDKKACEFAREDQTLTTWKLYLENFPKGECAFEAQVKIKKMEEAIREEENRREQERIARERAEKEQREREAEATPKPLLKIISERKEDETRKAEAARKKTTLIGYNLWSSRSPDTMDWYDAKDYCDDLDEDGYYDWRLPKISELRTLVKNCEQIEPSGYCGVRDSCLSYICADLTDCICSYMTHRGYYSKLGDNDSLWSSSVVTFHSNEAWLIDFDSAWVENYEKDSNHYVRCVR